MTPIELIKNAHSVESQGIPVDWKEMCMKVYTSAANRITELEEAQGIENDDNGKGVEPKTPD